MRAIFFYVNGNFCIDIFLNDSSHFKIYRHSEQAGEFFFLKRSEESVRNLRFFIPIPFASVNPPKRRRTGRSG